MACFLSVNEFHLEREFIFKEIALLSSNGENVHVWILKPPCPFPHLTSVDRSDVSHTSNYKLGLAWEDGTVPYKSLPSIFELISREYKHWYVEDERSLKLIFRYKSLNVYCKCVYEHPMCAVQSVVLMYSKLHSSSKM